MPKHLYITRSTGHVEHESPTIEHYRVGPLDPEAEAGRIAQIIKYLIPQHINFAEPVDALDLQHARAEATIKIIEAVWTADLRARRTKIDMTDSYGSFSRITIWSEPEDL